jgi:acetyl-CoA synthetase/medium-chain acyl-CoA synthetase
MTLTFGNDRIANRADYDRLRLQAIDWHTPEFFNFGFDVVDRWAQEDADHLAMQWIGPEGERKVTFSQMADRSGRLAQGLIECGLRPGDCVLVVLPRVIEWWETVVGLLKAGLIAIPGTTLLTSHDIAYRIHLADAAAIITDAEGAEKIDAIEDRLPGLRQRVLVGDEARVGWQSYEDMIRAAHPIESKPTRSDAPALVYFTSGTTGMPKMVLHTQASYGLGHALTGRLWLDLRADDLHWNLSDTGWAKAAWSSLFGPWSCGATLFVHHAPGKFDPADILKYVSEFPITSLCAAPTIYRWLVQLNLNDFQPVALRQCVAAGEPLNPEVISTWNRRTGLTIRDGYGQTETVVLCANFPGIAIKPGAMGLPTPGFDLAVIDEQGERLAAGKEGDLAVRIEPQRPLGLFKEYWRDPAATVRAFHDGWYRTGDCGRIDDDGYFWFVSRADDVITSSAYRIGPFEVENALIEHPAVVEAAVVGIPDAMRGEIVKAFVVLARGFVPCDDLKCELQEHVKRTTAPYKYPREIAFVAELPKTVSGKIRRVDLRRQANCSTPAHE